METIHVRTPLWESPWLTAALGAPVLLKMEALQPPGSFKARAMGRLCLALRDEGRDAVVCASGGNAGLAVAYAARRAGLRATIVVPRTTTDWLRRLIAREGAEVVTHGDSWDDAHAFAAALAAREGRGYAHPFDDPRAWEGTATLVEELTDDLAGTRPGALVLAVGGGGLLCGVAQGLAAAGWGDVPVLAVETEGAASFAAAVRAGRPVTLERIASVATSLGARRVADEALAWTRRGPVTPWVVSDRDAVDACVRFADEHRVLVEPACGAALAAVHARAEPLAGRAPVVVVVCGGAGVTRDLLARWDREVGRAG